MVDGATQDAKAAWEKGGVSGVAGAAGAVARGAITTPLVAIGETAYNVGAPMGRAAMGFGRGLFGMDDAAPGQKAAGTDPAKPAPSPAPAGAQAFVDNAPLPGNDIVARGLGSVGGTQSATPQAAAPNQVYPGVYQHGRGQYSDSPDGMGFKPGMGNPSQRNIQAADNLISRIGAASPSQAQPQEQGGMSIMGGGGFGLRDPNALAERNALVSAGSLLAAKERSGGFTGRRGGQPGVAAADVALQNFYKDRAQGNELANAAKIQDMRTQGDLTRAGMQEQGANQRASMTATLEGNKLAQAAQAQGFVNRSAAQMENLRNTLLDPKATPEQRKQAQEAILAIQGKQPQNEWGVQVTPTTKNLDGTTSMGSIVRYNKATGQTEVVQGGAQAGAPIDSNAQAISIRDNPSMTREQKVEALRKLGYS